MATNPTQCKIGIFLMVLLSLLAVASTAFTSNLAAVGLIFGCLVGLINVYLLRYTMDRLGTKLGKVMLVLSYYLRMMVIAALGYLAIKWLGMSFGMMLLLGLLPARFIYFCTKLDDLDSVSKDK